jgi:hypothetical protein
MTTMRCALRGTELAAEVRAAAVVLALALASLASVVTLSCAEL